MTPQERSQLAFNLPLRIEYTIDLAVASANAQDPRVNSLPDDLQDLIEATPWWHDSNPDSSAAPLTQYLIEFGQEEEDILAQLAELGIARPDLMGLCLKVATPIKIKTTHGSDYTWGRYTESWVFGASYEEAFEQAVQWAKSVPPRESSR